MTGQTPPLLRVDVITLFPDLFEPWASQGVCGRAVTRGQVSFRCWNPRVFTQDVHQTVDDRPYGGGPGMVMMVEPLAAAVRAIEADCKESGWAIGPVILFAPAGQPLNQAWVETRVGACIAEVEQAQRGPARQITLVCGRYEGIDQRFQDLFVSEVISLGDFVLSGGEIAALALLDAMIRRLPGVLGDGQSGLQESFMAGLLDHPHYTRPEIFEDQPVPSVLLSGHHGKIADWRRETALSLTATRRPDLIEALRQSGGLSPKDEAVLSKCSLDKTS